MDDKIKRSDQKDLLTPKGKRTVEKIINVAIAEFARNGYAGASISKITKQAGLNKSSIYAHFDSKADLFRACISEATYRRISYFKGFIDENRGRPITAVLYDFLMLYEDLGDEDSDVYFHERFAYFPPEELKNEITNFTTSIIIVQVQALLEPVFAEWADKYGIERRKKLNALTAFLSMYDGIAVERLIGTRESFLYRVNHAWPFYKDALEGYQSSNSYFQ